MRKRGSAFSKKWSRENVFCFQAEDGIRDSSVTGVQTCALPIYPAYFDPEQITDRSDRFQAAEFVREQVFRSFGEEVPYAVAVEITEFRDEPKHQHIEAVIWVEKEGQKAILIGKGGASLKEIGKRARLQMQKSFGRKVYLGD